MKNQTFFIKRTLHNVTTIVEEVYGMHNAMDIANEYQSKAPWAEYFVTRYSK